MKKLNLFKLLLSFMVFIAMFLSIVGCVNNVSELEEVFTDNNEPYEIIYYFVYNNANPPQDVSTVQTKLNAVLKKKINATIKIYAYTLAEYTSKVSGVVAANAKFDVCFTSPEINPYLTNVQREAFLPLDYLLPTYAPETWKAIPAKIWDQARINGKMYGSVNEQIFPRTYAFNATSAINLQSFLDEKHSGIKAESVNTLNLNAFTFLEEYMQWLKSNNRGNNGKVSAIHTESALQNLFGYDNLGTGMSTPGVVQVKDNNFTVVNQFDTDDYKKIVDTSYDWKNKGYLDDSAAGYDLTPDSNWKPGYLTGNLIRLSETNYFTSYVIGTMNAISSTSKNPARAMKFIELMRTDEEVHNLLQFGIEDIHYIKDPNNSNRIAEFISGSGYDNRNFGWGLGCEFTSYLIAGQDDNLWKQVKEINDNTEMSELIGFNFDASSVKQKIADCKAVVNEYLSAFEYAQYKDKDAKLLEFKQRLKAAGADEIIAEKQRQLNEFLAKKA